MLGIHFMGCLIASLNLVLIVAVIGVLVAWISYRDNARRQRQGVLDALDQELEMHRGWVGNEYPGSAERWWEKDYSRTISTVIFKLSTVAVDAAITNGPAFSSTARCYQP